MAPLVSAGARAATAVSELCVDRDVVITMLVEDATVIDVALGPSGLCDSLSADAIHLVMGTHGVATIRALDAPHHARGQHLVAAPVLGRPDLAAAGQLGIVAAGAATAVGRVQPLLT
jgi:3-hydroxyisobutyrate dehydrogenase-like beta-hydroxyacid dehydrogenase